MDKSQVYPPDETAPPYSPPPQEGYQADPGLQPGYQSGFQPGYQSGLQPGFQSAPGQPPAYIQTYNHVVVRPLLRDVSGQMTCPHCQTPVMTEITYVNGLITWLAFMFMAFFLCWICCCIPFCINSFKDVEHSCPNCKKIIYIYKRR